MATKLPDWLSSYLLARGLFSDRFGSPAEEETQVTQTRPPFFRNVPQVVLDGGLFDIEDAPSTASMPSMSSNQGLFGFSLPGFLGEIEKQTMGSIASEIARNTNYDLQTRIGGLLGSVLSLAVPSPLSFLGSALNAAGLGPSFDPEEDKNLSVDPLSGIVSWEKKEYAEEEPSVPSFARADLFDMFTGLLEKAPEEEFSIMGVPGIDPNRQFEIYELFDQYTATPEQQAQSFAQAAAESFDAAAADAAQTAAFDAFGAAFDAAAAQSGMGIGDGGGFGGEAEGAAGHDTDPGGDF